MSLLCAHPAPVRPERYPVYAQPRRTPHPDPRRQSHRPHEPPTPLPPAKHTPRRPTTTRSPPRNTPNSPQCARFAPRPRRHPFYAHPAGAASPPLGRSHLSPPNPAQDAKPPTAPSPCPPRDPAPATRTQKGIPFMRTPPSPHKGIPFMRTTPTGSPPRPRTPQTVLRPLSNRPLSSALPATIMPPSPRQEHAHISSRGLTMERDGHIFRPPRRTSYRRSGHATSSFRNSRSTDARKFCRIALCTPCSGLAPNWK